MNRFSLIVVTLVAALLIVQPSMAQNAPATLEGKIIVVYLKSDPKAGAVLEKVQISQLGDRSFLVGSGLDLGDPTRAGLIQWIPIDDIGRIHEFQDINDLRSRTKQGG